MADRESFLECTSSIVSAYISRNPIRVGDIEKLIADVYTKLKSVEGASASQNGLCAAVPVGESVFPDYLVCLEDGKKLKMLKRHLRTMYNMTLEEYKRKWGLPADYPSVASNYAKRRSELAREIGLGKRAQKVKPRVTLRVV